MLFILTMFSFSTSEFMIMPLISNKEEVHSLNKWDSHSILGQYGKLAINSSGCTHNNNVASQGLHSQYI